jgi:hypothetical protein
MAIEPIGCHAAGLVQAEAPAAVEPEDRRSPAGRGPAGWMRACGGAEGGLDLEEVARCYLAQLREEAAALRSVSQIRRRLAELESRRIVSTMKRQSRSILASGIFQGAVSIAASIASAVSAGVSLGGAAAASGASGGASGTGDAAAEAAKNAAEEGAKAGQRLASLKPIILKASPSLLQAASHLDPFRLQSQKLDVEREKHSARKTQREMDLRSAEDSLQAVGRMRNRVCQILERSLSLEEEGARTATNAIRA